VCRYNWHGAGYLPALAIFSMRKYFIFKNKIHGSNFIKQHSETAMVRNYEKAFSAHFRSLYRTTRRRRTVEHRADSAAVSEKGAK